MKFSILNETKNRLRIHMAQSRMTMAQADILQYYLENCEAVEEVKVHDRTCDAIIIYDGDRAAVIDALRQFGYDRVEVPADLTETSGRVMNRQYEDKLFWKTAWYMTKKWIMPMPLRYCLTSVKALKYIGKGLKCLANRKLEVPVLDATAITASILTNDFATAGSVMFLLEIGEILEEWTHKKSVDGLARSMSLNINKVWVRVDDCDVLMDSAKIAKDDLVVVHMGNVIPFDGVVDQGEGMVNQASLTGESVPVHKGHGDSAYAGTVVEEGELVVRVVKTGKTSRYDKVVAMIEESEKLKSGLESKAEHLADGLVPWTLGGTILTYLLTRNITKTLAVLMVDYSCALKMSMPIAVLSAIQEANKHHLTVKGGKFLEAVADADTIVFDKTGTLTKGEFKVSGINAVGCSEKELLEVAAYSESYSTHPIAESIKNAYGEKIDTSKLQNVEEIAGHGIHAQFAGKDVFVGNEKLMNKQNISYEKCDAIGTIIYVAIDGKFAGSLVISDEIKEGAKEAIADMKHVGVRKTVMLSGDQKEIVEKVANELGIDEYHAQLLPADKVDRVEKLLEQKNEKDKVAFVGDGINDAPVLTRADIGIAMGSMGSDAAIEAADVVLMDDDVTKIASVVKISRKTLSIVKQNIVFALGVKALVLILGAFGVANMWEAVFADVGVSVIAILNSMRTLKEE
mgnify:CR=1 FL=1